LNNSLINGSQLKTATIGDGSAMVDDDFRKIETDVLILRGSEDKMVTAESSMEVASWLANGTYLEIDGAPHPLEKVDMDVLVGEIVGFCGLESSSYVLTQTRMPVDTAS
jgi:hypothetical protein